MTFDGKAISDEEANSWDDDVSESEESGNEYYDEEDDTYDVPVPVPITATSATKPLEVEK